MATASARMVTRVFGPLLLLVLASHVHAGRISVGLEHELARLSPTDETRVLVVLNDPAGRSIAELDRDLSTRRADLATRHLEIVDALRAAASRSQRPILEELEARRSQGSIRSYHAYWIVNGIAVVGAVDAIRSLAARSDVDVIEPHLAPELISPVETGALRGGEAMTGVTPGIVAIQADRVWNELGIDGSGALVGNLDTGVALGHSALSARWRGNTAPASECWRDGAGFGHTTPTDVHGHGTHVMGTITGRTVTEFIGVAPGALWIADNSINQGVGPNFDSDVLAALQWFADPDGNPGTLDDVPDVVQNSWGVFEAFPGYFDCDSRWWSALDNTEAAGVVLTWSAGNEGAAGLRSPADRAASPTNTFSVGSTEWSPPYAVSSFSSRGPSGCGGPYAMKPEVMAPGSSIWSSIPPNTYGFLSGTSMAGPHVAGVVALMRSANPNLDVATIKQILMDTATDLGSPGEDNTYGHGLINAYEAVVASLAGFGAVEGTVRDASTNLALQDVQVTVAGLPTTTVTDASGFYRLIIPAGSQTLQFTHFGYATASRVVEVIAPGTTPLDLALDAASTVSLSGTVRDFLGAPVMGASVTVLDTPLPSVTSQANGSYSIQVPDLAVYDVRAAKDGFTADEQTVDVSGPTTLDFDLAQLTFDGFESGAFDLLPWDQGGDADWSIDDGNVFDGDFSARSGVILPGEDSRLRLQLDLGGSGEITFWMKRDMEPGNEVRFQIDGDEVASWATPGDWTAVSLPVESGVHLFEWRFSRLVTDGSEEDGVWIDNVAAPAQATPAAGLPSSDLAPTPRFQLGVPHPNPTRGASTIDYVVPPAGGRMELAIFDTGGRRVRTLVDGPVEAGTHQVTWDGRREGGARLALGTYFVRLRAEGFTKTRRVTRAR